MKYRLIKIAAVLVILVQLSSCVSHRVHTNRRAPRHSGYHGGDRYW